MNPNSSATGQSVAAEGLLSSSNISFTQDFPELLIRDGKVRLRRDKLIAPLGDINVLAHSAPIAIFLQLFSTILARNRERFAENTPKIAGSPLWRTSSYRINGWIQWIHISRKRRSAERYFNTSKCDF